MPFPRRWSQLAALALMIAATVAGAPVCNLTKFVENQSEDMQIIIKECEDTLNYYNSLRSSTASQEAWKALMGNQSSLPADYEACFGGVSAGSKTCTLEIGLLPTLNGSKPIGGFEKLSDKDIANRNDICSQGLACTSMYNQTGGRGVCAPCRIGDYCPPGTLSPFGTADDNKCPAGHVCPFSSCRSPCPAGYLCSDGSFSLDYLPAFNCDKNLSAVSKNAGVYCPAANTSFSLFKKYINKRQIIDDYLCPAGSHCSSSKSKKQCQDGHFCWDGTKDTGYECPWPLDNAQGCKDGRQTRPFTPVLILLLVALVIGGVLLFVAIYYGRRRLHRQSTKAAIERGSAEVGAVIQSASSQSSDLRIQSRLTPWLEEQIIKSAFYTIAVHDGDAVSIGFADWMSFFCPDLKTKKAQAAAAGDHTHVLKTMKSFSGTEAAKVTQLGRSFDAKSLEALHANAVDTWESLEKDDEGCVSMATFKHFYRRRIAQSRSLSTEDAEFRGFQVVPPENRFSFEFEDLGLQLKGKTKFVLKGVTGSIKHSSMVAVMGPSGAGKTSFMNAVTGRAYYANRTGVLRINGRDDVTMQDVAGHVGFVPQDDIVHDDLTVFENICFSARLRLPAKYTVTERNNIIEDVLEVLDIVKIRDSVVGSVERRGISGGQRKRVNIGLELAADPSIIFLDEPTSGLDATSSQIVLRALKELTRLGRTVISVIHQPRYSIFTMFDQCILLGVGGRTVYSGDAKMARLYFRGIGFRCPDGENMADFFMDVIAGEVHRTHGDPGKKALEEGTEEKEGGGGGGGAPPTKSFLRKTFEPSDLFDMWLETNEKDWEHIAHDDNASVVVSSDVVNREHPSWCTEFKVNTLVYGSEVISDWRGFLKDVFIIIVAAVVGGVFMINDKWSGVGNKWMTVLVKGNIMIALNGLGVGLSTITTFGRNRPLMLRELSSGANVFAYFFSRVLMDMFWVCFAALVVTALVVDISSMPQNMEFPLGVLGMFTTVFFVTTGWAYLITLTCDPNSGVILVSLSVIVFGAFLSGSTPFYRDTWTADGAPSFFTFILDLSWGRYATPTCMAAMAKGTTNPAFYSGFVFNEFLGVIRPSSRYPDANPEILKPDTKYPVW